MSVIGSKVDDLVTHYGYKYLGKRNGEKVYRRVVQEPVVRGFQTHAGYPTNFKLTEFAFVGDAGKVIRQSSRRVGTFGKATDAARKNVTEYTLHEGDNFAIKKMHNVEMTPRATGNEDLFAVMDRNYNNGLRDNLSLGVRANGEISHAYRVKDSVNPHMPNRPLESRYNYVNSFGDIRADYTEESLRRPYNGSQFMQEWTTESARKNFVEKSAAVNYNWNLESVRNPDFYKRITGVGQLSSGTHISW